MTTLSKTNVLLSGPIGTGKTSALRTIPECGHRLFVLALEPGLDKILTHSANCHWHYVAPATTDWDTMSRNADLVNKMSNDQLQKMKGMSNMGYRQFIEVLDTCAGFHCDICGEDFGAIDKDLRPDDVFAVDGLSGLSIMSMDLVVGAKPVKTQPDWGVAMDQIERIVNKWCSDTKCSFVLTSHIDREYDEITGGTKIMVSTLGRKLAPRIPRFFDEVVGCVRRADKFYWSTIEDGYDLKSRRLPLADAIAPDFRQLLEE
jgi:hypothetical protein